MAKNNQSRKPVVNVLVHFQYLNGGENRPHYKFVVKYSHDEESFKQIVECTPVVQDFVMKNLAHSRNGCQRDYLHLYFDIADKSMIYGAETIYAPEECQMVLDSIQGYGKPDEWDDIIFWTLFDDIKSATSNRGKIFFKVGDDESRLIRKRKGWWPEIHGLIA